MIVGLGLVVDRIGPSASGSPPPPAVPPATRSWTNFAVASGPAHERGGEKKKRWSRPDRRLATAQDRIHRRKPTAQSPRARPGVQYACAIHLCETAAKQEIVHAYQRVSTFPPSPVNQSNHRPPAVHSDCYFSPPPANAQPPPAHAPPILLMQCMSPANNRRPPVFAARRLPDPPLNSNALHRGSMPPSPPAAAESRASLPSP